MARDTQSDTVLVDKTDNIYVLTLNRPDKRNAANLEMQQSLLDRIREVAADEDARALILTGAGKAFSAGGDRDILKEIAAKGRADQQDTLAAIHKGTILGMLGLTIPTIAAVPGPAVGYAAGLVALCDFVVMGEQSYLSDPHVEYGIAATTAVQLFWPQLTSMAIAKELMMSGRRVDAARALELGLANRICSAGAELDTAFEMAAMFTRLPLTGVAATKRDLNRPLLEKAQAMLG